MLSQLSIPLVVNVDRPLHTSCLQMRPQTHEVRFYPSLCWSTFYRCLFQPLFEVVLSSQEFFVFTRLQFVVPMLSILSPDALQKSSHMNTERRKQTESNTEDTNDKIFLWVIGASTSFFVPLHTWRLSSVTVHCSLSTEDPSILGSTSTCLVLLIDFKSSGIASVTASLLLIHFFNSNPCCERRRGCSWLKTSNASSGVSTDLMKSSI